MNLQCITLPLVRSARDAPDLNDALRRVYEAIKELARCFYDVIAAAARKIAELYREFLDDIFRRANPKSYHLYKRAKKARVRNKNKNRLLKELRRWIN